MDFNDCNLEYLRFRLNSTKELLVSAEKHGDVAGMCGLRGMLLDIDKAIAKKLDFPCPDLDRNSLLSILREAQNDLEVTHCIEYQTNWDIWDTKVYEQIIKHYEQAIDKRIEYCGEF